MIQQVFCVCVCLEERLPTLNSSFIINADIFKCLPSGSTRLISSSLAYTIIENIHKSVLPRIHPKPRSCARVRTLMQRGI